MPAAAQAAVERVEVTERTPFAEGMSFGEAGAYEMVRGRVHYAVDPDDPANAAIVDVELAPRDGRGLVNFSGDFVMLRPADPAKADSTLLYEVTNRGGIGILGQLNGARATPDLRTAEDAGTGFLMRQGFTLLWSAWNWDVGIAENLQASLPVARQPDGAPIIGKVAYELVPSAEADALDWTGLRAKGYMPAVPDDPEAVLSVRDAPRGQRTTLPRDSWRFETGPDGRPTLIRLEGGFQPGRIYELVFTAQDPVVVGLGLAAVRDILSHAKQQGIAGAPRPDRVLAYGISQSGRFISHMLWQGFHVDEQGRPVFDGAVIHVAGGGKGSFNHRFAQTTRHFSMWEDHIYPTDFHPFAPAPTTNPVTGEQAGLLDRVQGDGPKLVFTNTSAEYWNRAASLIHTTPDGRQDVTPPENVRIYHLSGAQHFVARQRERGTFANCVNPLDHQRAMRAITVALRDWVRDGTAPPPNRHPTIADGTLVTAEAYKRDFPAIPGLRLPDGPLVPARLDNGPRFASAGIADTVPPIWGEPYPVLVPAPDKDGLDLGGIRLPDIEAPLGTHTGWNTRNEAAGAPGATDRWQGSFLPFALTAAKRAEDGDPRLSLAERYGDKAAYLAQVRAAADRSVADGFLLAGEVPDLLGRAEGFWDRMQARDVDSAACAYMFAE